MTLTADANNAKVVIKGDHESDVAIHLDGNADAASIVDIDAGILNIDTDGATNLTVGGAATVSAGAASTITTSAGDLTLTADATNAKVVIKGDHESDVAIHLDGNADAASIVDIDAGVLDIDVTGAANIDAGAASTITTSAGDLTLTADATNAKVVIKGDHESDVAIHLDGNAAAASIVDIDAGVLDIDVTGAANIDAGAASTITTSAGDLTLTADATNAKVVIKGDHESGVAIHLDGNADAASIVDIDAGILNIDTDGATNLTVGGAATVSYAGAASQLQLRRVI